MASLDQQGSCAGPADLLRNIRALSRMQPEPQLDRLRGTVPRVGSSARDGGANELPLQMAWQLELEDPVLGR